MGWPLPDELTLLIFTALSITEPLDALVDVCRLFRRIILDRGLRGHTLSLEVLAKCTAEIQGLIGFHVHARDFDMMVWNRVKDHVSHIVVDGPIMARDALDVLQTVDVAMMNQINAHSWDHVMDYYKEQAPKPPCRVRELIFQVPDVPWRRHGIFLHLFPNVTHLVTNLDIQSIPNLLLPQPKLEKIGLINPVHWPNVQPHLAMQSPTLKEFSVLTRNRLLDTLGSGVADYWNGVFPTGGQRMLMQPAVMMAQGWRRQMHGPVCPFPQCETIQLNAMEEYEIRHLLAGCSRLCSLTFSPIFAVETVGAAQDFFQILPASLKHLTLMDQSHIYTGADHLIHHVPCNIFQIAQAFDVAAQPTLRSLTLLVHLFSLDTWLQLGLPFAPPVECPNKRVALVLSRMPIHKK